MAKVVFQGNEYETSGLSLLDTLRSRGHDIPSGCRAGVCGGCRVRVRSGDIPPAAQQGLDEVDRAQGYVLACQTLPHSPLILDDASTLRRFETLVVANVALSDRVRELRLACPEGFAFRAGQVVQLWRDPATARSYSLAALPGDGGELRLHVARVPGGALSSWVFDQLGAGDLVTLSEAHGRCVYRAGNPGRGLLLVGTGTGLAPLQAIARDALAQGHAGPIHLYHGSHDEQGLYLRRELAALSDQHRNFHYLACISGPSSQGNDLRQGRASQCALQDHPDLSGWTVYLCGNPAMVSATRTAVFLAGASMGEIFADPFLPAGSAPPPA